MSVISLARAAASVPGTRTEWLSTRPSGCRRATWTEEPPLPRWISPMAMAHVLAASVAAA
jgi:hypothetical protein